MINCLRYLCACVLFLGIITLPAGFAAAGEWVCDDMLRPVEGDHGYFEREEGVRCEGLHYPFSGKKRISGQRLEIVSYGTERLNYDLRPDVIIKLGRPETAGFTERAVHIRVDAPYEDIQYRMDAMFIWQDTIYWPVRELLLPLRITPDKLSFYGWTGDKYDKIYVPLDLSHNPPPSDSTEVVSEPPLILKIRSQVDMSHMEYVIYDVEKDTAVVTEQLLGERGFAFAGHIFNIPIPPGPPGRLLVTVHARPYEAKGWLPVMRLQLIRCGHE